MRSSVRKAFRILVAAPVLAAMSAAFIPAASAFVWPNVPDRVKRALASGDAAERRAAAERLVDLPPELGLPLVQIAMADPDVDVRLHAAQAAIALRMAKAGDQVITWLSEGDVRLRLAACDVIRASPTDRSVVALGRVLGDPDPHVRLAAASAMGSSGLAEAVSPLLGHLDDQAPEVRAEVARALGKIGDARAVVLLITRVQDSASEVRRTVARALGELGDARATSALMVALSDSSQEVRVEAVTSLGKLRADEATLSIANLIEPAQEDPNMYAYGYGVPRPQGSVGAAEVRVAALRALGRIASEQAVKSLVGALAKDPDALSSRSPVRDALVSAGKPAVEALVHALDASPSQSTAAGAALVLGALKAKEGVPGIERAMQRGLLNARAGLRALAEIGFRDALPSVLERVDDPDPAVRKEAIISARALLDPSKIDGRPIDPAEAALKDPATSIDEKIELVRLLGATRAMRAEPALLRLAHAKSLGLRIAALEALGELSASSADIDRTLLDALSDEEANVRFAAAKSLSSVARADAAPELLDRLAVAAEQDRGAIGLAISGTLARATDASLAARVAKAVAIAPDSARDALIEGLGRMKGDAASKALAELAAGGIDDRRKIAESLAGHPEGAAALRKLAADPDPGVRASAAWSLGAVATKDDAKLLVSLVADADVAVAGNAAASLGRVAAREKDPSLAKPLCGALSDLRSYVRANALAGTTIAGARCDGVVVRELALRDPSEIVRVAAASAIARALRDLGPKADDADKRALVRCASEDRNAMVGQRCANPEPLPSGADDVAVYVVPESKSDPEPRAPFALVLADGSTRLGMADRRGEVFEAAAPRGAIRLGVPAALAR